MGVMITKTAVLLETNIITATKHHVLARAH